MDPSRNYLPGTCSLSGTLAIWRVPVVPLVAARRARDPAAARGWAHSRGSDARTRRGTGSSDSRALGSGARAVVHFHVCSQLRVLGLLTEPFALHRARGSAMPIRDRRPLAQARPPREWE